MGPTSTGHLETEGLHLRYDTWGTAGSGPPVVLLHGGVLNTEVAFSDLAPLLAADHLVIGLDQQAHGRSTDSDREITPTSLARDVVALLDHLGIDRAHVLGHSMGGAVALELAVNHGPRLLSVVALSASVRPDGMHADFASPEAMAVSTRMPTQDDFATMTGSYARLSPTPDRFGVLMAKMQDGAAFTRGWSDEDLARIGVPALVALGDHDFVTIAHAGLMLELIPGARLAVLPGTTHMTITSRVDLLVPVLTAFWGTGAPTGR